MEFTFELATDADEPGIRRLLASNPVPGRISVAYTREPNYFLGCGTMGRFCQVMVARHRPTGEVAGVGCRATRPLFVNGVAEEVGYLGQLRVERKFRGRALVSNGFRLVRKLHGDGRVRGYITTIIEDNPEAQGVLVDRPRRHFPVYRELDRLCVLSLLLRNVRSYRREEVAATVDSRTPTSSRRWLRTRPARQGPSCKVKRGSDVDLSNIVSFLRRCGSAKQFFPAYDEADFLPGSPTTRGFGLEDFAVAQLGGEIVGTVGLWDQSAYKQMTVNAYSGGLRWLRPLYNVGGRITGRPPLPAPGKPLRAAYASFLCVKDNAPDIFDALLGHLCNDAARRGYACLIVGFSARDPLLPLAQRRRHVAYRSRLYSVCWNDERSFHEQLDNRIPCIEIASL